MSMWQSLGDASSMEVSGRAAVRPRMLQGISRIRPEMMHKVLSSISVEHSQENSSNAAKKINSNASSCEQFRGPKLLDLFPEHKSDEQQQQKEVKLSPRCCESGTMDVQEKHSMCDLTIFYNGAVNVYAVVPDKAQEITDLANSILCKEESVCFNTDLKAAAAAAAASEETLQFASVASAGGAPASEKGERHKVPGMLAQVRKQSLQRFFQKRKDRLNSVAPFPVGWARAQIQSSERGASSQEDQDLLKLSLVLPSQCSSIVVTESEISKHI